MVQDKKGPCPFLLHSLPTSYDTTMYLTGLFRASDLYRFFSRQTIHELELDEEPDYFYLDGIDDEDDVLTVEPQPTRPGFIPSCFHSMVLVNHNDITSSSRPLTHSLVSPDDEIIYSTRRIHHVGWPSTTTVSDGGDDQSIHPSALSPSFSWLEEDDPKWVGLSTVQQRPIDLDSKNLRPRRAAAKIPKPIWPHGFNRLKRRRRRSVKGTGAPCFSLF